MFNLASFNLFWFPASTVADNSRSPEDEERIANVITRLSADAIVFQEILDVDALDRVLGRVPDRSYRVLQADPALGPGPMRVAAAFDQDRLELLEVAPIPEPDPTRRFSGRRTPLAMHFRDKQSQAQFRLIGVHFKSGLPSADDPVNDEKRLWEAECAAAYLRDSATGDRNPTFVLGDFNLEVDRPALAPLTGPGAPTTPVPATVRSQLPPVDATPLPAAERWSTLLDRVVIDHGLTANGAEKWLRGTATIYAFDLDPTLADPRTGDTPFYRVRGGSGVTLKPFAGAPKEEVLAMYRVSDHRPLRIDVEPT